MTIPKTWQILSNVERKVVKNKLFDFWLPHFTKALDDDYALNSKDMLIIFNIDKLEKIAMYENNGNVPKSDAIDKKGLKAWNLGNLRKLEKKMRIKR